MEVFMEKQGCFFSYFLPGSKRLQPCAVGEKSENTIPNVLDNIKRLIWDCQDFLPIFWFLHIS